MAGIHAIVFGNTVAAHHLPSPYFTGSVNGW